MRKSSHEPVKAVRSWAVGHFWLRCFCFPEGGGATGASRSEHLSLSAPMGLFGTRMLQPIVRVQFSLLHHHCHAIEGWK